MKTLIIILFLSLSGSSLFGQSFYYKKQQPKLALELSTEYTRSIHGPKIGFGVNVNLKDRWHMGYFNLRSFDGQEGSQETFEGVIINYMLNPGAKFVIGPAVKVGFYNKYFMTILPSLQATYKINDMVSIGAGAAYSDGFPSFDLAFNFQVFKK